LLNLSGIPFQTPTCTNWILKRFPPETPTDEVAVEDIPPDPAELESVDYMFLEVVPEIIVFDTPHFDSDYNDPGITLFAHGATGTFASIMVSTLSTPTGRCLLSIRAVLQIDSTATIIPMGRVQPRRLSLLPSI
jgi:hypothetical protein